jgi:hypothetical protein
MFITVRGFAVAAGNYTAVDESLSCVALLGQTDQVDEFVCAKKSPIIKQK